MSTIMGRLFIRLEKVVTELDFHSDQEKDEFLEWIADSMYERLRQALLTWRANKRARDSEPQPASEPVPEHLQRERERTAARQKTRLEHGG